MYQPPIGTADFLILRHTAPKNLIMPYDVMIFSQAMEPY